MIKAAGIAQNGGKARVHLPLGQLARDCGSGLRNHAASFVLSKFFSVPASP